MMSEFYCSKPSRCGLFFATAMVLGLAACTPQDQGAGSSNAGASSPTASPASAAFTSYSSALPSTDENNQCSLDTVNNQAASDNVVVPVGSDVMFGGWAGDGKGSAAKKFLLLLKGAKTYSASMHTGIARPDVAKALSSDGMANSGFNVSASLTGVLAGTYTVFLADPVNAGNVCASKRKIVLQ